MSTPAWGDKGHRIVARIAWARLTPAARSTIATLLANESFVAMCQQNQQPSINSPAGKFVCIATWADKVRDDRPETSLWHFVDIPLDAASYLPSRDCPATPRGDCVIKEIERAFAALANPQNEVAARNEALKFIVHFIGDMHQPLHDATDTHDQQAIANGSPTDRGGNLKFVTWLGARKDSFNDNWQLHAVWDKGIIANVNSNEVQLAQWLLSGLKPAEKAFSVPAPVSDNWPASLPQLLVEWSENGNALAVSDAYKIGQRDPNDIAIDPKSHKKYQRYHLGAAYLNTNAPVVKKQLRLAGVRLARVLNEALR